MTLFCFDVDGTLLTEEMKDEGEYVKGVIPTHVLEDLERKGHKVAIVSPSPFLPDKYANERYWFKVNGSNTYRWENVAQAMKYYEEDPTTTVYVDDLEANRKQLENLGVRCYDPEAFLVEVLNKTFYHKIV